jgi:hypothetical protein
MELSSAAESDSPNPTIRKEVARTMQNLRRLLQRFVMILYFYYFLLDFTISIISSNDRTIE